MCLVAPGHVIGLNGTIATVDVAGRRRQASVLLEPDVLVGDWVIVAGGAVLRRIDASAATAMEAALALASTAPPVPEEQITGERHE
jgi:hydrogenase expression/formation protein HypC